MLLFAFAKVPINKCEHPTVHQFVSDNVENLLDYKKRQLVKHVKKHLSEFGWVDGLTTAKLFYRLNLVKAKLRFEEIEGFEKLISGTQISLLGY